MKYPIIFPKKYALQTKYQPNQMIGHYENFSIRGNHPTKPLSFLIKHTIFSPNNYPENAIGELWFLFYDGIKGEQVVLKEEIPFSCCHFHRSKLDITVGRSYLNIKKAIGEIKFNNQVAKWDINYGGGLDPIFLLPKVLYVGRYPRSKTVVSQPMAKFSGTIEIDGKKIELKNWIGSQNHNWGERHSSEYTWGQVAGFNNFPETFFEIITGKFSIGPLRTPVGTVMVLNHRGKEIHLNRFVDAFNSKGGIERFRWNFSSESRKYRVKGTIFAPKELFVGLLYYNPNGGVKHCLNTQLATCDLEFEDKKTGKIDMLLSKRGTSFEIATKSRDHGIRIRG